MIEKLIKNERESVKSEERGFPQTQGTFVCWDDLGIFYNIHDIHKDFSKLAIAVELL